MSADMTEISNGITVYWHKKWVQILMQCIFLFHHLIPKCGLSWPVVKLAMYVGVVGSHPATAKFGDYGYTIELYDRMIQ